MLVCTLLLKGYKMSELERLKAELADRQQQFKLISNVDEKEYIGNQIKMLQHKINQYSR